MPSHQQQVIAGLAGAGCAAAVVAVAMFWSYRKELLPALEIDTYDQAWALWKSKEPLNYNIRVQVFGRQPAVYEAQVRDGVATSARHNGHPLTQLRTLGTWSVPGMFNTIGHDVEAIQKSTPATPTELTIRGTFDEQWGYPLQYQRIQWGSDHEVHWRVLNFEVLNLTSTTETEQSRKKSCQTGGTRLR